VQGSHYQQGGKESGSCLFRSFLLRKHREATVPACYLSHSCTENMPGVEGNSHKVKSERGQLRMSSPLAWTGFAWGHAPWLPKGLLLVHAVSLVERAMAMN